MTRGTAVPAPILYRIDDQLAAWNTIEAPVLMLLSDEGFVYERFGDDPVEQERRLAAFRNLQVKRSATVAITCSTTSQHEVAAALERYLARTEANAALLRAPEESYFGRQDRRHERRAS